MKRHFSCAKRGAERDKKKLQDASDKKAIEAARESALQQANELRNEVSKKCRPAFTIETSKLTPPTTITTGDIAQTDGCSHVPKLWKDSKAVKEFLGNALVSKVLAHFGCSYKKQKSYSQSSLTQQPTQTKQGLEEFHRLFAAMNLSPLNIGKVNQKFNDMSWIFGMAPEYGNCDILPSAAAQVRVLSMGSVRIVMARASQFMQTFGDDTPKISDAVAKLRALTETTLPDVLAKCEVYAVDQGPSDVLLIPQGFIVLEHVIRGPLIYGFRKSLFQNTPEGKADLQAVMKMMSADGRPINRLAEVISLHK